MAQALAILEGGSWWRLETFGHPYINKPPLLPWLITILGEIFGGANAWAARLPAVASVTGAALAAGLLAFRAAPVRGSVAALAASIYFLGSQTVFVRARLAETDASATALAAAAFLIWALARLRGRVGALTWAGIAICFAALALVKGPVPMLFPLTAMVVVPLLEHRWREFAALGGTVVLSTIPVAIWIALNADHADVAKLSGEMRLTDIFVLSRYLFSVATLVNLAESILQSFPAIVPAAIFIYVARSWRRRQGDWLPWALFLYAVPMFLVVAVWPHSGGRYVMPSIWPFAVMAGLVTARYWPGMLAISGLALTLAALIAIQVAFLAQAGRTEHQIAAHAEAEALASAVAQLPDSTRILVATPTRENLFNRFVYVGRNLHWIGTDELACPPDAAYLISEGHLRRLAEASGHWRRLPLLQYGELTLFERVETSGSNCPA